MPFDNLIQKKYLRSELAKHEGLALHSMQFFWEGEETSDGPLVGDWLVSLGLEEETAGYQKCWHLLWVLATFMLHKYSLKSVVR